MDREGKDSKQPAHGEPRSSQVPRQSLWSKFKAELSQWHSKPSASSNYDRLPKRPFSKKKEEPFVVPIRDSDILYDTDENPAQEEISLLSSVDQVPLSQTLATPPSSPKKKPSKSKRKITPRLLPKPRFQGASASPSSSSSITDVDGKLQYRKIISFVSPPRVARPANPSILAIELHGSLPHMTVEWLLGRMLGSRRSGGAHMDVTLMISSDVTGPVFHISSPTKYLLEVAERVGLVKMTRSGKIRRFSRKNQYLFYDASDPLAEPLSSVEKQQMVVHELSNIRCLDTKFLIPGLHNAQLTYGQRIVPECLRLGVITHLFPVHEKELRLLTVHQIVGPYKSHISKYIIPSYASQVDAARMYLGEEIAYYLALLRYVAFFLLFPAILGIVVIATSRKIFYIAFQSLTWMVLLPISILLVAWSAILLYTWRRTSDALCMHWGTQGQMLLMAGHLKPAKHRMSALRRKPPGPRTQFQYQVLIKVYAVSIPITALILCFFFFLAALIWPKFECFNRNPADSSAVKESKNTQERPPNEDTFRVQEFTGQPDRQEDLSNAGCFGAAIGVSLLAWIFGRFYVMLAYALTEWESHHSQRHFENYLVAKVALFTGIVNFGPIYYMLLLHEDLDAAWVLLVTLVTTHVVLNILQETVFFQAKECVRRLWHDMPDYLVPSETYLNQHTFHELPAGSAAFAILIRNYPLERAYLQERNLPSYRQSDEANDYTELFILLAFVSSFLIVMPMMGLLVTLYCWFKLLIKTHKLSSKLQRPLARTASDIGPWKVVLEVTTFASVATNCLILSRSYNLRDGLASRLTDIQWSAVFIMAQHGLFVLLVVLGHYSPRCPELLQASDTDDWTTSSDTERHNSQTRASSNSLRPVRISSSSSAATELDRESPVTPPSPPSPPPPTPIRHARSRASPPRPSMAESLDDYAGQMDKAVSTSQRRRSRSVSPTKPTIGKFWPGNLSDPTDEDRSSSPDALFSDVLSSSDGAGPSQKESNTKAAAIITRPRSKSETYIKE